MSLRHMLLGSSLMLLALTGCKPKVNITYTKPAQVDLKGIKRLAVGGVLMPAARLPSAVLLKEDMEETEQSMPQPQPGEGEPQQGEGEPGEKKPGEEGDEGKEPPPGKGEGEEEPKDGKGGEKDKPEGDSGKNKDDDKKDSDKDGKNPDETPEERARRILKENADLEKGPLTPGRREFRAPEKDW